MLKEKPIEEELLPTSSSQDLLMKALQSFYKEATRTVLGDKDAYLCLIDKMADIYCAKDDNDDLWGLIKKAKGTSKLTSERIDILAELLVLIEEFYS